MINGTDGKKMSKSAGNCIWLTDPAEEIFVKIMSMSDDMISTYYELLTDIPLEEIKSLDPTKPIENKKRLAFDITRQLHNQVAAQNAQAHYENVISAKAVDANATPIKITGNLIETLKNAGLGISNSNIKRTIEQGGVEVDGVKLTDPLAPITGSEIKFGKSIRRKLVS